jgi:hypothetical protein
MADPNVLMKVKPGNQRVIPTMERLYVDISSFF